MDNNHLRRRATSSKPHRPALTEYIEGRATLEDLVAKGKITKPHERHNQQALLACINSMDETPVSSSIRTRFGGSKTLSTKSSHRTRSKHESTKATTDSDSLRSAHGDTSESISTVTKANSVIFEQQLNDREKEITALREEITNLKSARADIVSVLRKLIEDLSGSEHDTAEPLPDECNAIVERLCDGVRALTISCAEKDKKLALFRANNEQLQKRVTDHEPDLRQLSDLRVQNEKLRADIETASRAQLQNYDENLRGRAQQLQDAFNRLENICRRHIRWLEQTPREEIEHLEAQIDESETTRRQQICEVGAELIDHRKQFTELQAFCAKLSSFNRSLRIENQHLQRTNEILQGTYCKQIDELTTEEQLKAAAVMNMRTLDAEKAYSQEIISHIEEMKRATIGSNDQ